MTDTQDMDEIPIDELESQLAEVLDEYVSAVHRNDGPRQHELLAAHPELKNFVEPIESLDRMTPDIEFAATLLEVFPDDGTATADESPIIRQFGRFELLEELDRRTLTASSRSR